MAIGDIANALNEAADEYGETQRQFTEAHGAHATAEETLRRSIKESDAALKGTVAMSNSLRTLTEQFEQTRGQVDRALGFVMLAGDTLTVSEAQVANAQASTDAIATKVLRVTEQTFNGKVEEGRGWSRMLASDAAEHAANEPGLRNALEVTVRRESTAQERHDRIASLIGELTTELETYTEEIRAGNEETTQTHAIAKQQMVRSAQLGKDAAQTAKILRAGAKTL